MNEIDRRGVSPIVGIVLVVGLVVALSAGVALTVFGIDTPESQSSEVSSVSISDGKLTVIEGESNVSVYHSGRKVAELSGAGASLQIDGKSVTVVQGEGSSKRVIKSIEGSQAKNWPYYSGNVRRTGKVSSLGPFDKPQVQWRNSYSDSSRAVVGGGLVYFTQGSRLVSVDAGNGSKQFSVNIVSSLSSPEYEGGIVYVSGENSSSNVTAAVYANNGSTKWTSSEGSKESEPLVVENRVFVVDDDTDDFVALYASNGTVDWRSSIPATTNSNGEIAFGAPSYVQSTNEVAITTNYGKLVFFDVSDGTSEKVDVAQSNTVFTFSGAPSIANGNAYAAWFDNGPDTEGGLLASVDVSSKNIVWRDVPADNVSYLSTPSYNNGRLFVPYLNRNTNESGIVAHDASDGDRQWFFGDPSGSNAFTQNAPALAGGLVYFADDDGEVHALQQRTGDREFTVNATSVSLQNGDVAVVGGRLYSSDNGKVVALGLD